MEGDDQPDVPNSQTSMECWADLFAHFLLLKSPMYRLGLNVFKTYQIWLEMAGAHSPVVSSAPSILQSPVQFASMPYFHNLYFFIICHCDVKKKRNRGLGWPNLNKYLCRDLSALLHQ